MAGGGMWRKTLVYFGLADEDYEYDDDMMSDRTDAEASYREPAYRDREPARREAREPAYREPAYREPAYRERQNVKRLDRESRRRPNSDFDDIFAEEGNRNQRMPSSQQRGASVRSLPTAVEQPQVRVHLVMPKNFNDAQVIADKYKGDIPVILNLQSSETELAKRLIDFASGLTYALDGGMQRVADKVFLLTPKNVEVSAEERQRMLEKGFFNQF
jgi:cell division inhibitor SepF